MVIKLLWRGALCGEHSKQRQFHLTTHSPFFLSFFLSFFFLSFSKDDLTITTAGKKHSCKTDFILMTQFSILFSLFSLFEFNFSLNAFYRFILFLTLWLSMFCAYHSFCQFRLLFLFTCLNPSISLAFSLSFFLLLLLLEYNFANFRSSSHYPVACWLLLLLDIPTKMNILFYFLKCLKTECRLNLSKLKFQQKKRHSDLENDIRSPE